MTEKKADSRRTRATVQATVGEPVTAALACLAEQRAVTWPLALVLLLAVAGCGAKSSDDDDGSAGNNGQAGSDGGTPMQPMIVCPDPSEAIDPTAMIDDFEDGEPRLPERDGRNGGWWTAADTTVGATMVPQQSELSGELAPPELLPEPRCGSRYAMRVSGQGFTDWGAVLGMSFVFGTRPNGEDGATSYDASSRTGVDFWAKIGDTSTNQVRYQVSDSNSEPDGGKCVVMGGSGLECFDSFGTDLTQLDTTWHHYRIPFAGLSQRDFGLQASGLVTTEVYQVTFNFLTASPFDFWVDDIMFY